MESRRTPHGVRGLKLSYICEEIAIDGRTPHGVRGLKFLFETHEDQPVTTSHPARGAWIEIHLLLLRIKLLGSHPARGAWIEISEAWLRHHQARESHPARGAWIEIFIGYNRLPRGFGRTPHGVRGLKYRSNRQQSKCRRRTPHGVRGLKWLHCPRGLYRHRSHPARGAWIEIRCSMTARTTQSCRTPHGVRGLKLNANCSVLIGLWSHPARGAWIEIVRPLWPASQRSGRTPHGVRGLKFLREPARTTVLRSSHPARGAWIEIT